MNAPTGSGGPQGLGAVNDEIEEYVRTSPNETNIDHIGFKVAWSKSTQRDQVKTVAYAAVLLTILLIGGFLAIGSYGLLEKNYAEKRQDLPALLSMLDSDNQNLTRQRDSLKRLEAAPVPDKNAIEKQTSVVRATEFVLSNRQTEVASAPALRNDYIAKRDKWNRVTLVSGLIVMLMVGLLGLIWVAYRSNKRLELMQAIRLQRAEHLATWQSTSDIGRKLALRKQMDVYQRVVINYTRSSRHVATASLLAGFGLVAAVIITGLATSTGGVQSIASAVVGTASAGLGAYLGSTVISNLKDSQAEMLEFFKYPVREDRIIAAKEVATEMTALSGASEARMEIVRGILNDNVMKNKA